MKDPYLILQDAYLFDIEKDVRHKRTRPYQKAGETGLATKLRAMTIVAAVVAIAAFAPWGAMLG